ncbi:MAG: response regulator transcription factor [Melioribacteraceae bacterium]|nr:response regulator transcription factor [Melioribacteraceae bacterium]
MAKKEKILLVEDEESLAVGLQFNLEEENYEVKHARDGREALEFYNKENFDLIILDIMLPYIDGFEVAKKVRESNPQLPILMLTARTRKEDKIHGLELGADDYITKPFHLAELLLRVKGMLKRKKWYAESINKNPVYKFGNNEINFETLQCKCGENEFRLTHHEAMAMQYLIEHKSKPVLKKRAARKSLEHYIGS